MSAVPPEPSARRPMSPLAHGALLVLFLAAGMVFWRLTAPPPRPGPTADGVFVRAVEEGRLKDVERMLQEGRSANTLRPLWHNPRVPLQPDDERLRFSGTPVLEIAARNGDSALIYLLLSWGAKVNARGRYGYTALFAAAGKGNLESIRLLLSRGADPNVQDTIFQESVLHRLVAWPQRGARSTAGNPERLAALRLLVEAGANPKVKDRRGRTPAEAAERAGHTDLADYLKKSQPGAKRYGYSRESKPTCGASRATSFGRITPDVGVRQFAAATAVPNATASGTLLPCSI